MSPGRHSRQSARRIALDILYQADQRGELPSEALEDWREAGEGIPRFAEELVAGVEEHQAEIDKLLGEHAEEWTVHRMVSVDRAILRLACYELLHRSDVPAGAAINEAVEAAKELSTEDSGRFVNGILGKIARGVDASGGAKEPNEG